MVNENRDHHPSPRDRDDHRRRPSWWVSALLSLAFAAAVGVGFWLAWHPKAGFYLYNIPIAVPFAGFFLDRWGRWSRAGALVDAAVLALALSRVAAPPLPFASGHALFAGYAMATANGWVLRATGALVLAQIAYMKLFVTGGVWSLVMGLAFAAAGALARRKLR